jgi:CheY-like chemotaxis protein
MDNGNESPDSLKGKKTVLIVEDDTILSRMYAEKFDIEGISTVIARNGEEALEIVNSTQVDAVLLDIVMPRITGIQFLKELRKIKGGDKIPVVALSNLADEAEKEKAIDLGVKSYLIKAMQTPEKVVEEIKKFL